MYVNKVLAFLDLDWCNRYNTLGCGGITLCVLINKDCELSVYIILWEVSKIAGDVNGNSCMYMVVKPHFGMHYICEGCFYIAYVVRLNTCLHEKQHSRK